MNVQQPLKPLNVDVINYLSIAVLENQGVGAPTEQQIQSVEARLERAIKKGALNLRKRTQTIKGATLCY